MSGDGRGHPSQTHTWATAARGRQGRAGHGGTAHQISRDTLSHTAGCLQNQQNHQEPNVTNIHSSSQERTLSTKNLSAPGPHGASLALQHPVHCKVVWHSGEGGSEAGWWIVVYSTEYHGTVYQPGWISQAQHAPEPSTRPTGRRTRGNTRGSQFSPKCCFFNHTQHWPVGQRNGAILKPAEADWA